MNTIDSGWLLKLLATDNKIVTSVAEIGSFHAFGAGADRDFVVLIYPELRIPPLVGQPVDLTPPKSYLQDALNVLQAAGFTQTSLTTPQDATSSTDGDHFVAMRNGDVNLMVTEDRDFYTDSMTAFEVVKALDLRNKADRIKVHKIVVDGYAASDLT